MKNDFLFFVSAPFTLCYLAGLKSLISEAYKSRDAMIKRVSGLQFSVIGQGELILISVLEF